MQTTLIRTIISQAVALPTQVEMPSIVCRRPWTLMGCGRSERRREKQDRYNTRHRPDYVPDDALPAFISASELLGRRVGSEIVVVGHAAAHHRVLLPLRRALCEFDLRLDDLLEDRIFGRLLLRHLVVDLELLLQNRVRRLVE